MSSGLSKTVFCLLISLQDNLRAKTTNVRGVGSPIRHLPTSSLPKTMKSRTRAWCLRSTHPPLCNSAKSSCVAWSAISSGAMPGCEAASAQWITPVVDSARMLKAYPGDLRWIIQQKQRASCMWRTFRSHCLCKRRSKDKCPGYNDWVQNGTPLSFCLRIEDWLAQHDYSRRQCESDKYDETTNATPRMRLILPASTKFNVLTCLMVGQRNWTSPPPPGGAPLFLIFRGKFFIPVANIKVAQCSPLVLGLQIYQIVADAATWRFVWDPPDNIY